MSKSYKWAKVMKQSITFVMTLSITLGGGAAFFNSSAKAATQNRELICSSTAYTSDTGTLTSSGKAVKRNPNGISTVAVDPNVIPLGSALYIEGYGYAIAADTGSAIKGNVIDLYFDSYSDCDAWGRKTVNVMVLGDSSNS